MTMKTRLLAVVSALMLALSPAVFACGGENSGKHIGMVTAMDASKNTFRIRDMESGSQITFNANAEIMAAIKKNPKGHVMVNYEENDEGALQALGVTF